MKIKTTFVALSILFSLPIFSLEEVVLGQLKAHLNEGHGNISVDSFSYRDTYFSLNSDNINQEFSFRNSLLELNLGGIFDVNYQLDPAGMISKISAIQTDGLNLHYIPDQKLSVLTSGISLSHSGGSQYIPQLLVECKRSMTKSGYSDFINPCLELGRIEIPVLDFDELSSQAISKALTGHSSNKSIEKVEDVALLIFNGNFQLSFKAKFLFKLTVKAQGTISHNEEDGAINLHLNKAKVGILSIKNLLLKELREANISGIQIIGDRITFKM